jgi:hypothetical protein
MEIKRIRIFYGKDFLEANAQHLQGEFPLSLQGRLLKVSSCMPGFCF